MEGEARDTFTKHRTLAYEIADYFPRFVSYLVDLVIILSIVTILLVYIYNELAITYLFPFYYLYTHDSISSLVLNNNGVDFSIFYLLISFTYYLLASYIGYSPGNLTLNIRTMNVDDIQLKDHNIAYIRHFVRKIKYASLRSLFLTVPFFPLFDNIFAKDGAKLTDKRLKTVVVHPLHIKKVRINKLFRRNQVRSISKISSKMISYPEFLSYYGLEVTNIDQRNSNKRKKENRARRRFGNPTKREADLKRINTIVSSNEFFLNGLTEGGANGSVNKADTLWKVTKTRKLGYFYAASLLYFIPFTVAIIVGWHTTSNLTFYTPPPLLSDRYVSTTSLAQVQMSIFSENFAFDLKFLVLGGFTMFFLPYLGIYSSVYLPNIEIAGTLHTQYWYYIFYALFPHLFEETFAYVLGIISGLYLSKFLVDIVTSYSKGVNFNEFLRLIYFNLSRFAVVFAASFSLLLAESYIEAYFTSYILNQFYFIH